VLEIPDKFAAQLQQYLQDLVDADTMPTLVDNEAEAVAEGEEEAEADAGAEGNVDMTVEEDLIPTSVAGSDGEEDALALTKQGNYSEGLVEDLAADSEADIDAQGDGAGSEIVEETFVKERAVESNQPRNGSRARTQRPGGRPE
jgi:hypothetical protein